jgi:hypothetical protein
MREKRCAAEVGWVWRTRDPGRSKSKLWGISSKKPATLGLLLASLARLALPLVLANLADKVVERLLNVHPSLGRSLDVWASETLRQIRPFRLGYLALTVQIALVSDQPGG